MAMADEDRAMESIEQANGVSNHRATVDPSKLLYLPTSPDPLSPKLPFHGLASSIKMPPIQRQLDIRDQSDAATSVMSPDVRTHESTTPMDSDTMDVTPPPITDVQVRVPPPPRFPPLPYSSSKTGLVYDDRMKFHAEVPDLMINPDDIHPEDPRRIYEIFNEIQAAGLVQASTDDEDDAHEDQCWRIHVRHATAAEICLVHTPEHFSFIESLQSTLSVFIGHQRHLTLFRSSIDRAQATF